MLDATGEANQPALRISFDRRIKLRFHRNDHLERRPACLHEADDTLELPDMPAAALGDGWRGGNIRHQLVGLLRQAVYCRLAGYEDLNDAKRLARNLAMRAIVGRDGLDRPAAPTSQMGRLEIYWLATEADLAALTQS